MASSEVRRTAAFDLPVRHSRGGGYTLPAGSLVYTCFTSDFLVAGADEWRAQAWAMMRRRHDLYFLFFTKRIDRLLSCLPPDWGEGYPNVTIGCTVENQAMAQERMPLFLQAPIRHKMVIVAPMLEAVDLSPYLNDSIEEVSAGGESGPGARPCHYDWVLALRRQCVEAQVPFTFHQTGANFIKDGHLYHIARHDQLSQARRAAINYRASHIFGEKKSAGGPPVIELTLFG